MGKPLERMTEEELGMLFPILLCQPDPGWTGRFQKEKREIEGALGPSIIRIEHIGSTAVPGIMAKPSIDILLEVQEATADHDLIRIFRQMGYHYIPKPENPAPHMMFVRGYTTKGFRGQAYHIHVRYRGEWDEIRFRDYLIAHPAEAKEYEALKIRLSMEFRNDREGYTAAKGDFIKMIHKRAGCT
jgi:GrpB-like predicted nucleotidyltransferase (UPF0157 family)